MSAGYDKIVVVTRRTALEELSERLGTRGQAKFYIQQEAARLRVPDAGGKKAKGAARAATHAAAPSFDYYESADTTHHDALAQVRSALPKAVRAQWIDSAFLPTFTFGERDIVLVVGPDGLVVNVAKYLDGQPLVAVNPDPGRIEGALLPFRVGDAGAALHRALFDPRCPVRHLTMAEARLSDGQVLRAVNDLFIGQRTHVSARYRLRLADRFEDQSSSGIIVSTGTGSTGWLRSVVAGAAGIVEARGGDIAEMDDSPRFDPTSDELRFSVREPWPSRTTGATLIHGRLGPGETLEIVSQMPRNGCIFGDGVEADYLPFDGGAVATVGLSSRKVALVMPG